MYNIVIIIITVAKKLGFVSYLFQVYSRPLPNLCIDRNKPKISYYTCYIDTPAL